MWPLNLLKRRHWIFLGACVLFLASYSGFISWGKVAQALERLADQPAVRERFATPIGRGEAIVTSFMFVLLVAAGDRGRARRSSRSSARSAPASSGRSCRYARCPTMVFLAIAYVGVFIGICLARAYWTGPAWEFVGPHRQGHPHRDRTDLIRFGGPPALCC